MSAFLHLSVAILKGFVRDRASVFFAIIFPLMFLVLFGGLLGSSTQSKVDMVQIGDVALFDSMPAGAREAFEETFQITRVTPTVESAASAVEQVRKGDADVAVQQVGDRLVAHVTLTDQTKAAITAGTLQAYVDRANVAASGKPPAFSLETQPVEDDSFTAIQFVTPGLLGWAVAMSAAFGAAATLNGWRNSKLLRRLQLAPVSTGTLVAARVAVTVAIALGQMAIFLGLGVVALDLKLAGQWWASIPVLVLGTLCFMSVGLLAGAVAKTTEGAVNMANFVVMPMAFLSGSFFPLDAAPQWLQTLAHVLPLFWLNDAMMDVMVRGEAWTSVLLPCALLVAFAAVITALAAKLFRWEAA